EDCSKLPQCGAKSILRQLRQVERDRRDIELGQRLIYLTRTVGDRHECSGDDDEHNNVEKIRHEPVLTKAERRAKPRSSGCNAHTPPRAGLSRRFPRHQPNHVLALSLSSPSCWWKIQFTRRSRW